MKWFGNKNKNKNKKLVMTLLVRDEEDVLRANIEFHRAQGVDFFIVTDNKSEDSTPDIVHEYERQGIAHYIFEAGDDFSQSEWVTRMARMAATKYGADWVINNDADEFWWPRQGNLRSTFSQLSTVENIVVGQRHNFVPVADECDQFFCDMVYRKAVSLNTLGRPLPPKVAHRAHRRVVVKPGNHRVDLPGKSIEVNHILDIFHFPVRRYSQFTNKIINGGQAIERNTKLNKHVNFTWRQLYKEYQQNGLVDFYNQECLSADEIELGLHNGELVVDRRLSDYLQTLNFV